MIVLPQLYNLSLKKSYIYENIAAFSQPLERFVLQFNDFTLFDLFFRK